MTALFSGSVAIAHWLPVVGAHMHQVMQQTSGNNVWKIFFAVEHCCEKMLLAFPRVMSWCPWYTCSLWSFILWVDSHWCFVRCPSAPWWEQNFLKCFQKRQAVSLNEILHISQRFFWVFKLCSCLLKGTMRGCNCFAVDCMEGAIADCVGLTVGVRIQNGTTWEQNGGNGNDRKDGEKCC